MNCCAVVPQLAVVAGRPVTTSLNVAQVFGKRHDNIVKAIRTLGVPEEFNSLNFEAVGYSDAKGERRPMFNITRDGFTILVMGFTGSKAMQFKLAYLAEFNRMEAELHALTDQVGDYNSLTTGPAPVTVARLAEAAQGVKAAMIMARALGYRNSQAVKIANNLVRELTGIDALELLGPSGDEAGRLRLPLATDQPPAGFIDETTLAAFVAEKCEQVVSATLPVAEAYHELCAWLRASKGGDYPLPSENKFHHAMSRHFRHRRIMGTNGRPCRIYQGVKLAGVKQHHTLLDNFRRFLDECCEINPEWQAGASDLYTAFRSWWLANINSKPISQRKFGDLLTERFEKSVSTGRVVYLGVALLVRAGEVNHG